MDKKLLYTLLLSVFTFWAFQYFTRKPEDTKLPEQVKRGQGYTVPTSTQLQKTLNLEVDFIDKKITKSEKKEFLNTDKYCIGFSSYGGVVSNLIFKDFLSKNEVPLKTIYPKSFYDRITSADDTVCLLWAQCIRIVCHPLHTVSNNAVLSPSQTDSDVLMAANRIAL